MRLSRAAGEVRPEARRRGAYGGEEGERWCRKVVRDGRKGCEEGEVGVEVGVGG